MTNPARPLAFLVVVAALAATGRDCPAEIPAGRRPPTLETLRGWGDGPSSLRDLRGRAVLLVFVSTTCPRCQGYVPHMNALAASRAAHGLRVVAACRESADRIEGFARNFRLRTSLVQVETEALRDFEVTAYPAGFLLSSNGRILWSGDPAVLADAALDRLVAQARPWGPVPESLSWAVDGVLRDEIGVTRDRLARCAAGEDECAGETRTAAGRLLSWVDWYASSLASAAEADRAAGRPCDAWRDLDHLARALGERDAGARAHDRADEILSAPGVRREVEACDLWEAARRVLRREGATRAMPLLDRLAVGHAGTEAGRRAADLAARLRRSPRTAG